MLMVLLTMLPSLTVMWMRGEEAPRVNCAKKFFFQLCPPKLQELCPPCVLCPCVLPSCNFQLQKEKIQMKFLIFPIQPYCYLFTEFNPVLGIGPFTMHNVHYTL